MSFKIPVTFTETSLLLKFIIFQIPKSEIMKHLIKIVAMTIAVLSMTTCSDDPVVSTDNDEDLLTLKSTSSDMCKTNEYILWAGRNIDAGTVLVENDGSNLYITVCSNEGFQNVEENIKVLVGKASSLYFDKRPVAGHFPYKFTAEPTSECFSLPPIPLSEVTGKTDCVEDRIEIIVHVDVMADGAAETAFSGKKTGIGNAWWYYISYRIACCSDPV